MNNKTLGMLCLLLTFFFAKPVKAEFVFNFSTDSGATFTNSVNGLIGEQFVIELYMSQTNAESRLDTDGLLSFGTRSTYDGTVATFTDPEIDSSQFLDLANDSGTISATEFALVGQANFGATPRGSNIRLGRFTININSAGTTEFQFGDFDPNFDDSALSDPAFTSIDHLLFSIDPTNNVMDRSRTFRLTINGSAAAAVPEPTTMGMLFLGLMVATSRRRVRD